MRKHKHPPAPLQPIPQILYLDPPATQRNFITNFHILQAAAHQGTALAGKPDRAMTWIKLLVPGSWPGSAMPGAGSPCCPPAPPLSSSKELITKAQNNSASAKEAEEISLPKDGLKGRELQETSFLRECDPQVLAWFPLLLSFLPLSCGQMSHQSHALLPRYYKNSRPMMAAAKNPHNTKRARRKKHLS